MKLENKSTLKTEYGSLDLNAYLTGQISSKGVSDGNGGNITSTSTARAL